MHHSELAQLVEHTTVNRAVVGSSPTFGVQWPFQVDGFFYTIISRGANKLKIRSEEEIQQLVDALHEAQKEADKWRTGAEIYQSQATELQETMQLMAEENERLRQGNEQVHQATDDQGKSVVLKPVQKPEISSQELAHHEIIEDALINKIQQLEQTLANR